MSKVTYHLNLDMSKIPKKDRVEAKNKIGEYLKNKVKEDAQSAKSSVNGRSFKRLSKKYADKQKGGNRKPNLTLSESMLNSLDFKRTRDGIEFGIFGGKDALKADNHNKFSADSEDTPVPKRQFIPNESDETNVGKTFRPDIRRSMRDILDSFRKS